MHIQMQLLDTVGKAPVVTPHDGGAEAKGHGYAAISISMAARGSTTC